MRNESQIIFAVAATRNWCAASCGMILYFE